MVARGTGFPGWRDGVITGARPWMTAENAANPEPAAAPGSVGVDGFEKVVGTGGRVAASSSWSGEGFEQRIQKALIEPNEGSKQPGDWTINHQWNGEQGREVRDAELV
jgi:hypothetical protein